MILKYKGEVKAVKIEECAFGELKQLFKENNLNLRKTEDNTLICDEWQEILYYDDYILITKTGLVCFNKSLFEFLFTKEK